MTWGALTCIQGLQNELIRDVDHVDYVGVLARHVNLEVHITVILGRKNALKITV